MKKFLLLFTSLFIISITFAQQSPRWIFMAKGGDAYNFKSPLVIKQNEHEDIRFNAKYKTEGFTPPLYLDFQIIKWNEDRGWGFRVTHHKLYLQNNPPEVQRFTITDGYNLITITRQWKLGGFIYHVGGGAVLTHPESTIRGQELDEFKGILNHGYYISGPVAEAGIEKRIDLSKRFLLSLEGRATASYVKVPIANGHARTSNIALHGLAGIGYKLYGKK